MLAAVLELLERTEDANVEGFRAAFQSATDRLTHDRQRAAAHRASSPIRDYMIAIIVAARGNSLRVPVRILAVYRALLVAETVAHELGTEADLVSVGRHFFAALQTERMFENIIDPRLAFATTLDVLGLVRSGPDQLQRLLSDLTEDRFVLQTRTSQSLLDRRVANTRAQLLAVSIVSVGVAALCVGTLGVHVGPLSVGTLVFVGLLACYVWLVVIWRRLQ